MKVNSAYLLTSAAAVIWGATAPIMKLTLTQIPVFSLAFLRMAFASLILGVVIFGWQAGQNLKIDKRDFPAFLWSAITGVTLNLTFFFIGLKLTQAILAAFLVASVPIFTMIAAHFYLGEKFTFRLVVASVIAFIGVAIIIGGFEGPAGFRQILGNILLLLATLSWVAHEIIAKKLLKIYDAATVTFYSMAIGAVTFLPLFLWEFWQSPDWLANVNWTGAAGLLYGIFLASLAAYWAWQKGLSLLPAGQAAFFFYLDPVSGALLSIILLGEKLTPTLIVGGFLVAAGVFLVQKSTRVHPLHKD